MDIMDKKIIIFCLCALIAIFVIPSVIFAASFDCTKAPSEIEKLVCSNADISKLDDELSKVYKYVYARAVDREDQKQLKLDQLSWLKKRDACVTRTCIRNVYNERLSELIPRLMLLGGGSECSLLAGCTKFANSGANKALWKSSGKGDVGSAKAALLAGADPNVCGPSYERPLHVAVSRRDLPIVRELLRAKANPDVQNCRGDTPLVLAAYNNDVNVAVELLSAGADTEGGIPTNPLQIAAFYGYVEMLRALLSHHADPNSVNGDTSALMAAASYLHVEAVQILLESGADPNLKTGSYEGTALFDAVGGFRVTPLKQEEEERALKIVKLLVQYGANVNAKTAGHSPLERARAIKESTIVDFLISVGAKP
jgi:ankyrin repeat protein/uncharacterized protein YecT (DUF1311 family)